MHDPHIHRWSSKTCKIFHEPRDIPKHGTEFVQTIVEEGRARLANGNPSIQISLGNILIDLIGLIDLAAVPMDA